MPNLPTDGYTPSLIGDDYVFVTDDGRVYSVTFTEQPFFTNKQFELADRTYELFLTLEKAPPSYVEDPEVSCFRTTVSQRKTPRNRMPGRFALADSNLLSFALERKL